MQSNIFERTLHVMQNKCALIIETLENKHEQKKKLKSLKYIWDIFYQNSH